MSELTRKENEASVDDISVDMRKKGKVEEKRRKKKEGKKEKKKERKRGKGENKQLKG